MSLTSQPSSSGPLTVTSSRPAVATAVSQSRPLKRTLQAAVDGNIATSVFFSWDNTI